MSLSEVRVCLPLVRYNPYVRTDLLIGGRPPLPNRLFSGLLILRQSSTKGGLDQRRALRWQEANRRKSMEPEAPSFFWAAKIWSLLGNCWEHPWNKGARYRLLF